MNTKYSIAFRFLYWLSGFPIVILVVAFAVFNRHKTLFYWSPLHNPIELPLSFFILAAIAFGFLAGALISWINTSSLRRERRAQKQAIKVLEQRLEAANGNKPPVPKNFYALPPLLKKNSDGGP